ncbi:hypothetical protein VNI00_004818 [Paramarasmius palmivorus]|uniref:Uncharacterized protein n=1 Tax=Paramarasmius palmivorus TaxID=297713 RepID=A0AAW0DJM8_9AGAR
MSSSASTAPSNIVASSAAPSLPGATPEVQSAMTYILGNVPWMKFRVCAEPDVQLFKTDAKLQQALAQISQGIATSVAQILTTEFTSQTQALIKSVTPQISTAIVELIQQLIAASAETNCCKAAECTEACPLTASCIPELSGKPCGPITATKPPSLPDLSTARWIWTKEAEGGKKPPIGARPFRKTLTPKVPVDSLIVDITCDDAYSLYVNGYLVGSGRNWGTAQRYRVAFYPTCKLVIAIYGAQDPNVAGLIVSAVTWNSLLPDNPATTFVTDASWKTFANPTFSSKFIKPCFDDSTWDNATVEVAFGEAPWGGVVKPTGYTAQNPALTQLPSGIPDAPKADAATVLTQ